MSRPPDVPGNLPNPPPAKLDYSSPFGKAAARGRKRFGVGFALGGAGSCGTLAAAIFLCGWIVSARNPDNQYAVLTGGLLGAVIELVLLLVAAAVLIPLGYSRNSPVLRGAGFGSLLTLGLVGLGAGICAVAAR
jgi:hypothetical protein